MHGKCPCPGKVLRRKSLPRHSQTTDVMCNFHRVLHLQHQDSFSLSNFRCKYKKSFLISTIFWGSITNLSEKPEICGKECRERCVCWLSLCVFILVVIRNHPVGIFLILFFFRQKRVNRRWRACMAKIEGESYAGKHP